MGTGIQMQGLLRDSNDQAAAIALSNRIHSQPHNIKESKRSTGASRAPLPPEAPIDSQPESVEAPFVLNSTHTTCAASAQRRAGHALIAAAQPTPKPFEAVNIRILKSFKNQKKKGDFITKTKQFMSRKSKIPGNQDCNNDS